MAWISRRSSTGTRSQPFTRLSVLHLVCTCTSSNVNQALLCRNVGSVTVDSGDVASIASETVEQLSDDFYAKPVDISESWRAILCILLHSQWLYDDMF